jgi:1-acyl-sn-glycerol-3-phosphate acyltransferase
MRSLLGAFRLLITVLVVLAGALFVLAAALLRLRHKNAPLAAWICTWVARVAMIPFGIRYRCHNSAIIRAHSGLILPNHITLWEYRQQVDPGDRAGSRGHRHGLDRPERP